MKILSLFDGISCARVALERIGLDIEYYASEVDKYAISIAQRNYPSTVELGSVVGLKVGFRPDLLIGGSPCQDLSIAKKNREGLKGQRSGLFFEYVRILNDVKPKFFVLENVNSMPKEAKEQISEILGVQSVMINAALVSAQNRKRLFWVGKLVGDKYEQVEIEQPEDRGILLKDILESEVEGKYYLSDKLMTGFRAKKGSFKGRFKPVTGDKCPTITARYWKMSSTDPYVLQRVGQFNKGGQGDRVYSEEGKSVALSALGGGRGAKTGLYLQDTQIRKLTPIECERLQGLPDNYTEGVSNTQRYKALGNAFNVDVVAHILRFLFK